MAALDFTDLERDAIGELFNLGLGRAAASLSELVLEEVRLSAPVVQVLDRSAVIDMMTADLENTRAAAVVQRATGPFDADGMLVFPQDRSMNLVRKLVPDEAMATGLNEAQQEVLSEIGNLVLNACFSSFADLLGAELNTGLPHFRVGEFEAILAEETRGTAEHVLFLQIEFSLVETKLQGFVMILLDIASLTAFRAALARLIA